MRDWIVNQLVGLIQLLWPDTSSIQISRSEKGQHIWGAIHPLPKRLRGAMVGWEDFIVMEKEEDAE